MEPGSIIKPFTIGKALDWGFVTPQTEIDCNHGVWIYLNKPLRDSHPYDKLTVEGVIQKSSNIGTAKVAMMLGEQRVYQALKTFRFGDKTGLPFPIEESGLVLPVKKWDGLSITRFPIGYGVRVTPLQMIRAYCALANNGKMPQLRLIDRLEDPVTGEVTRIPSPPPVQMFDRPETCATLISMMIKVTQKGGTAVKAAIPGYEVAGKTGTAETNKEYNDKSYASRSVTGRTALDHCQKGLSSSGYMLLTSQVSTLARDLLNSFFNDPEGAYQNSSASALITQSAPKDILALHIIRSTHSFCS